MADTPAAAAATGVGANAAADAATDAAAGPGPSAPPPPPPPYYPARLGPGHGHGAMPSCWEARPGARHATATSYLRFADAGLCARYVGPGDDDNQAASCRSDRPIPSDAPFFYWELSVEDRGASGFIGVGFCTEDVNLGRLPGWEPRSYGYHGDDGCAFRGSGRGWPYGPRFGLGDTVGVLLDRAERTIRFFLNGQDLGPAFTDVAEERLYPMAGMRTRGESVRANFGGDARAAPFRAADFWRLQAGVVARAAAAVAGTALPGDDGEPPGGGGAGHVVLLGGGGAAKQQQHAAGWGAANGGPSAAAAASPPVPPSVSMPLMPALVFQYLMHHRCWRTAAILAREVLGDGDDDDDGGGGGGGGHERGAAVKEAGNGHGKAENGDGGGGAAPMELGAGSGDGGQGAPGGAAAAAAKEALASAGAAPPPSAAAAAAAAAVAAAAAKNRVPAALRADVEDAIARQEVHDALMDGCVERALRSIARTLGPRVSAAVTTEAAAAAAAAAAGAAQTAAAAPLTTAEQEQQQEAAAADKAAVDAAVDAAVAAVALGPHLLFRVRVQQFLEAVRRGDVDGALAFARAELGPAARDAAEASAASAREASSSPGSGGGGGAGAAAGGAGGGLPPAFWLGRRRRDEELLQDALSLLAYDDPASSPCGHLLRPQAREALAAKVNGALLGRRGAPREPAIERIYRQAAAALEELRWVGDPRAAVLDADRVVRDGLMEMMAGDKGGDEGGKRAGGAGQAGAAAAAAEGGAAATATAAAAPATAAAAAGGAEQMDFV